MGNVCSGESRRFKNLPFDVYPIFLSFLRVKEVFTQKSVDTYFERAGNLSLIGRKVSQEELDDLIELNPPENVFMNLLEHKCLNMKEAGDFLQRYFIKRNFRRVCEKVLLGCKISDHVFNYSVRINREDIVRILLQNQSIDPGNRNNLPLRICCEHGYTGIFKMLVETGEKVDVTAQRQSALRLACEMGHLDLVELLLEMKNVDPSACNSAAFGYACENGHIEIVKTLLKDGRIDPSADHNFALRGVALNNQVEVLKLLLKLEKVDPCEYDNYSLRYSAARGHYGIVEVLMKVPRVRNSVDDVKKALEGAKGEKVKEYLTCKINKTVK